MVEILLDSEEIELVMSLEFARKQKFKLKKIERPIYVRNLDGFFNKKRLIEHIVEVNILPGTYKENKEWCDWWSEMKYDFRNVMAYSPQSWNWLENRGSKYDEISKKVWKAVETKAEEARITEVEEGKERTRTRRKKARREEAEEREKEKGENNKSEKYGRRTGNLG